MSALLRTHGVVRLANRRLLQLQGVDASRFIQAILTNDMKSVMKPGDTLYGGFLTTKGRLLGDCSVVQTREDTFLLDYDASVSEDLMKHWKRYKLRMKVKLEDKSDVLSTYATLPASIAADDTYDYSVPENELETVLQLNSALQDAKDGVAFVDPRGKEFGVRAILPASETLNMPDNYETLDLAAYNDRRIFLGAAEGKELSDGIPLESNLELLHGVSFRKGCYVGQELTARTQFKGNVRKRIVPLALIPSDQQDVITALSELSFQRIDSPSHASLREYLVNSASRKDAVSPEQGGKIVKTGSTKAVGTIVNVGNELPTAIAMMRLEHLLPKEEEGSEVVPQMQFTTLEGDFHAIPYQPTWWPELDLATGKMKL
ncbi:Transferase caf17 mitochondrial-like, partial [Globisporangium splendens]